MDNSIKTSKKLSVDDIVERLREEIDSVKVDVQVLREAADEIERLRERVEDCENDFEVLSQIFNEVRAERDQLRALCNDLYHDATCYESFCRLCGEGIREWEARHG